MINLDCIDEDELWAFNRRYHRATSKEAVALVGERKDARKVARRLATYAINKYTAMLLRKQGKIAAAGVYEDICDRIYDRDLPPEFRW